MENSEKDIYFYLEMIYLKKWVVVLSIVIATVAGAMVARMLPSYYRSTTLILVEQQQVPEAFVTPTDKTPFNQRLNTIRQQIMSRSKLEKIISEYKLYQSEPNPFIRAARKTGLKGKEPLKEEVLERMSKDIEVKLIGDSRGGEAFSVSYSGTDPYITMQVTNTLSSLFIEENLKVRERYAEGTSFFLSDELDNAKKELEALEKTVRGFKERNMGGLPQQLDANLRTLDRLQAELQAVNNQTRGLEDKKLQLESVLNQPATTPAGAPVNNSLAAELEKLQHDLVTLLSMYTENYPDVLITKRRINEIKGLMNRSKKKEGEDSSELQDVAPELRNPSVVNNIRAVEAQIASLKRREDELKKQVKLLERRVDETPAAEQKFADLRRDYDMSLKNYQALLEKKLNARLSENLEKRQKGERFTIIDPANLPEKPYKPNRSLITAIGSLAGAGLSIGLVLILELMKPTFRKPEEFAGIISLPVLATISEFSSKPASGEKLKLIKKTAT